MSALASILIGAALRVGASTVKTVLEQQVGGVAGEIGATVIDAIAKQAGVTVDELPTVPQSTLDEAVSQVEPIAPALILAEVEQQKEANRSSSSTPPTATRRFPTRSRCAAQR